MKRRLALFLAVVLTIAQFSNYIFVKAASDSYTMNPDFFTTDGGTYNATSEVTTYKDASTLSIVPDAGQSGDIQIDRWNLAGCNINASDYKCVTADYYYDVQEYTDGSLTGWSIGSEYVDNKEKSKALSTKYGPTIMGFDESIVGDANPDYVVCLADKWQMFRQGLSLTTGKTYVLTCDYYMPAGATGSIRFYGGSSSDLKILWISGGSEGSCGTAVLEYTVTGAEGWYAAGAQQDTDTDGYYWNFSVTEKNTATNLLSNGDFATGDFTSWEGYSNNDAVVAYNEGTMGDLTPEYMLKLHSTYTNDQNETSTWKEVYQSYPFTAGKTYVFTCDYYMPAGAQGHVSMRSGSGGKEAIVSGGTQGKQGTVRLEYTTQVGDDWTTAVLMQNTNEGGEGYYWNLRVTEKDSNVNVLKNADFSIDDVSVHMPDNMVIRLCEQGDNEYTWSDWKQSENAIVANEWSQIVFDVSDFNMTDNYGQMHFFPWGMSEYSKGNTASGVMYIKNITFLTEFPGTSDDDDVESDKDQDGLPSGTPEYMAKLVGSYVDSAGNTQQWKEVNQFVTPEAGKTYEFSFSYYVADEGTVEGRLMGNGWSVLKQVVSTAGEIKTAKITYTATEADEWLAPLLSKDTEGVAYVWNLCFNEVGQTVNLLQNADFSEGDGSWIGWEIAGQKVTDKTSSNAVTASFGHEIVQYDDSLFENNGNEGENVGGNTSTTPTIPSGDPTYMAKLIGTYKDSAGNTQQWKEVNQIINVEAGKTYEFSFSYFVPGDGTVEGRLMGEGWKVLEKATSKAGEVGTVKLTYTAKTGDTWVSPLLSKDAEGIAYVWNLCFNEKGQNVNLLKNADFSEGKGTWIGWEIGGKKADDKAGSNAITASFGHEIIKFDKSLFKADKNAEGKTTSAIPSGEPTYMAKLIGTYVDANGKKQQWKEMYQTIFVQAGKTYEFSFNYFVPGQGSVEGRLKNDKWETIEKVVSETGEIGTAKITYQAQAEDTWIAPLISKDTEGIAYVWNLCFNEVGGDVNLYRNADFAEEDGTWIGWNVGGKFAENKADSDYITTAYGHEIIEFNKSLFEKEKGNASALNSAINPNYYFDFDEVGKYKALDVWSPALENESGKKDNTKLIPILCTGGFTAGAIVAICLLLKKKKGNQ